jgi:hypothetical protein
MKHSPHATALALALAAPLSACGANSAGEPTLLGVPFTLGAKANAKLVSLSQKLDAGGAIVLTDVQGLCQLGAKVQPAVTASASLIPSSAQAKTQTVVAGVNAAIASPTCRDPTNDSLQEIVDLANTIVAIKAATGGVVTATKVAGA